MVYLWKEKDREQLAKLQLIAGRTKESLLRSLQNYEVFVKL